MITMAEYIWLDGAKTQGIRSKARAISLADPNNVTLECFEKWTYDGSSTYQSTGESSDLFLQPVFFCPDPIRGEGSYLVLCEVLNADDTVHSSNTRAILRRVLAGGAAQAQCWIGFEQEYTFMQDDRPLGFPEKGFPQPQGPFYCGVGSDKVYGREIVEDHIDACHAAQLPLFGVNAEVMPGQWEYQIGYRGFPGEHHDLLLCADQAWITRYLLQRISESYGVVASFDNKPVKGDWNGAGCHTNFSTQATRDEAGGLKAIEEAIEKLSKKHTEHIRVYGEKLEERLTGLHETCAIDQFRHGVADRGSSVRIPQQVQAKGYGYFEDRRPGANSDPYLVASRLAVTVCGLSESLMERPGSSKVSAAKSTTKETV